MEIQLAKMEHLGAILDIYRSARAYMAKTGNPSQWGSTHPEENTLVEDICKKQLHICTEGGEICGVFAFILGEDPTYGHIEGNWHHSSPYGTIHRIASNGAKRGVFSRCIAFCESKIDHLRIDTHHDNKVMQDLVAKHGFSYCGIIYLANGSPRLAYDRKKERAHT